MAGALDYAHRQHVVHRDIKPENILLQDGQAIVADFGIARAVDPGVVDAGTAETIPALGTPAYMSPEQATRTAGIDGRSDIYALGCVLYEMLAGAPPFNGSTVQVILDQHAAAPVPSVRAVRRDVPLEIERAVTRALQKAPADRFATAGSFRRGDQPRAGCVRIRARWTSTSQVDRRRRRCLAAPGGGDRRSTTGHESECDSIPTSSRSFPSGSRRLAPRSAWLRREAADLLAGKLTGELRARARPIRDRCGTPGTRSQTRADKSPR